MHGRGRSERRRCSQQLGTRLRRGSSHSICAVAVWHVHPIRGPSDAAGSSGGDWRPVMRMSFLEAQRHAWRRALRAQGVLSAAGNAAVQGQLPEYLRSGSLAAEHDAAWKQVSGL
jgi:hypothetical protein